MNILNYYVLNKNNEDKDFYFENEGIFNFWNKYLIAHIGLYNIVLVNRTDKIFHGDRLSDDEKIVIQKSIKENFCDARNCKKDNVISFCDLLKEWGTVICNL